MVLRCHRVSHSRPYQIDVEHCPGRAKSFIRKWGREGLGIQDVDSKERSISFLSMTAASRIKQMIAPKIVSLKSERFWLENRPWKKASRGVETVRHKTGANALDAGRVRHTDQKDTKTRCSRHIVGSVEGGVLQRRCDVERRLPAHLRDAWESGAACRDLAMTWKFFT